MQSRIIKLDSQTVGKIAAGEVVEKPAMVVKELVENAIDAGASEIVVDIKKGGKRQIRVSDNGRGIHSEDLPLVFERHATSKIRTIEDLYETRTLGFRGEALASIAAVSSIDLITMQEEDSYGLKIEASAGTILSQSEVGAVQGTTIIVKDLFFNTPARLKFLKSDQAEGRAISELMGVLAISHPEVAFKYVVDEQLQFNTPGRGALDQAIFSVFESSMVKHLVKVDENHQEMKLTGYISKFDYTKGSKGHQFMFVNGRFVKSALLKDIIQMTYKPYLMNNRYAVCFLFLEISPNEIDVNIHPAKTEIKFHDEGAVKQLVYTTLKKTFNLYNQVPQVSFTEKQTFVAKEDSNKPFKMPESPQVQPAAFHEIKHITEPQPMPKVDFEVFEELHAFAKETDLNPPVVNEESAYDHLLYIGAFDKTYLLFEKNNQLIMIDQHAAHEKVLYEQFMKAYERQSINGQILLIPEMIEMTTVSFHKLGEASDFLNRMGFEFDYFGEKSLVLRQIPAIFEIETAKTFFLEILDGIQDGANRQFEEKLASKACKSAIKAHDHISDIEVESLIEDLKRLEDPYTCPHGRPIIISISKNEIERKFKRVL